MKAQIRRDVRDRPVALKDQPGTAIKQLRRVLAWAGHQQILSQGRLPLSRGLRQTQPGSIRLGGMLLIAGGMYLMGK